MPWGKYKGDHLTDIPSSYIMWLLDAGKVSDKMLTRALAVEMMRRLEEMCPEAANQDGSVGDAGVHDDHRRYDPGPRPTPPSRERAPQSYREEVALQVIAAGYKVLAMKIHPDKGGSAEAMKELNSVREALKLIARRV